MNRDESRNICNSIRARSDSVAVIHLVDEANTVVGLVEGCAVQSEECQVTTLTFQHASECVGVASVDELSVIWEWIDHVDDTDRREEETGARRAEAVTDSVSSKVGGVGDTC